MDAIKELCKLLAEANLRPYFRPYHPTKPRYCAHDVPMKDVCKKCRAGVLPESTMAKIKSSNETRKVQKAKAVVEVVRKRITYRGPRDELIETNVVDSLVALDKKTIFAAVDAASEFKWVQVIDGKPVQAFRADELLVIQ